MNPQMAANHKKIAVIGAGIAGLACARTLDRAGHHVTLFEKGSVVGGRASSVDSPFGSFDHGTQYFTVRDSRFEEALATAPNACRRWSANAVRVLDPHGRMAEVALPAREAHWVAVPAMDALPRSWAYPLVAAGRVEMQVRVTRLEPDAIDAHKWQLQTAGPQDSVHVYSGFDHVLLAMPNSAAISLLLQSRIGSPMVEQLQQVKVAPCWTLMLAFPQASQPALSHLGPQWNAALSTHHRIAWLARESSKPGREPVERWTVQASAAWSQEHLEDDEPRVQAKLLKAFSEVTGIHAEPAFTQMQRWRWAKTQAPLGRSHMWDRKSGLGACGDWCIGHRLEDAFISGLELALAVHDTD
jgi:renalase